VGLIARIENEARLAFILSHELAHVHHDHSINRFIINKSIDSNKDKMSTNDLGFDCNIFNKSLFSKSLEKEEDEEGLKFFSKTKYSNKGVEGIFDILYNSLHPYVNKPFNKTFF
jgi:predicted Zn-dependent protease